MGQAEKDSNGSFMDSYRHQSVECMGCKTGNPEDNFSKKRAIDGQEIKYSSPSLSYIFISLVLE